MSFKFNMQKVLDYRERLEEEAKARLAMAESRAAQAEARLKALCDEQAAAEEKGRSGVLMSSAERWLHDQHLKGLAIDVRNADLQARLTRQMVEEARQHLAARAIDKKLLENLKKRKKTQYIRDERKQEQYFNDEIATIRYKAPAI